MPCQKLHPSPDLMLTLTELLGQIWKAESTHHKTKVLLDEFQPCYWQVLLFSPQVLPYLLDMVSAHLHRVKILSHHLFWAKNSERNLCELLPHKWIWRTNVKQTSVIITAERLVRWSSCSIWAFPRTVNRPWPVRYASNILPSRNSYETHHKMSHLKPLPGPSDPSYQKPTISSAFPPFPVTIES